MKDLKTIKAMRLSLLIALLSTGFFATSCQIDECRESVCVEKVTYLRSEVTTIDLSGMTEDVEINGQGNDDQYQTTGDLNLNGFKLRLVNIQLTVVGNVNGNGTGGGSEVVTLGTSKVCVQGSVQNNPYYNENDFTCESLSGGGLGSVYDGSIEVECGEFLIGDVFRNGNYWYEIVECY